jgi:hypothetical protein
MRPSPTAYRAARLAHLLRELEDARVQRLALVHHLARRPQRAWRCSHAAAPATEAHRLCSQIRCEENIRKRGSAKRRMLPSPNARRPPRCPTAARPAARSSRRRRIPLVRMDRRMGPPAPRRTHPHRPRSLSVEQRGPSLAGCMEAVWWC